jgi:hypothetical protein
MPEVKVIQSVGRPLKALVPIRDWSVEVGEWMIQYLLSNDRKATGDTVNSIEVTVTKPDEVVLSGAPSLKWALAGRKAGKAPPVQAMKDWILAKPIQMQNITLNALAFLIGRKIARSGTSEPKLRQQNLQIVVNNLGKKYVQEIGEIQAKEAALAMTQLLVRNIPNTTKK